MPESEEYGVTSFVFRSDRPFHPKRLHELINSTGEVREPSLYARHLRVTDAAPHTQQGLRVACHAPAQLWRVGPRRQHLHDR